MGVAVDWPAGVVVLPTMCALTSPSAVRCLSVVVWLTAILMVGVVSKAAVSVPETDGVRPAPPKVVAVRSVVVRQKDVPWRVVPRTIVHKRGRALMLAAVRRVASCLAVNLLVAVMPAAHRRGGRLRLVAALRNVLLPGKQPRFM